MHNLLPGQLAGRSQFGWRRSHLNLRTLVAISITTHYGGSLQITPGYCSQQQVRTKGGLECEWRMSATTRRLDAGPGIQYSMHRRQGASLMASAGVTHCQCGSLPVKLEVHWSPAPSLQSAQLYQHNHAAPTTAPFAAVSATLHGAAFVCTNQMQIWRSLAATMACLLRRGYTLDCQTWAESLDAQPRSRVMLHCSTLLFTPCVDRMRAGTHSGNAVPAETYPQM
jgi:hypothetical protein